MFLSNLKKELLPLNRGFASSCGHSNGTFDNFPHQREGALDRVID